MKPKLDRASALKLRTVNNLSLDQIAKLQGVSRQSVKTALDQMTPPQELIESYQKNLSGIIKYAEIKQLGAYHALTPAEQKDMILRRGMVDFGILYDKHRLEDGKSTEIIDVYLLQANLNELDAQEKRIVAELKSRGSKVIDVIPEEANSATIDDVFNLEA